MSDWNISGKLCVVTGANAGIGKQTAIGLARLGARVVMVCRNPERGEAARADVASATGAEIELMQCDMASFASMRDFAARFAERHDRLDVLVNNAGMMFAKRELTEDGLESTFAVNHLGYYMITNLLRDLLIQSAPARVVVVASTAHKRARLDWENLQGEKRFSSFKAYALSKLCNILFTYELARRLEGTGVTANCLHPGVVASNFGSTAGPLFRNLVKIGHPFLMSPERGARTSIYVASAPELADTTGTYFARSRPARSSAISHDRAAQARLWQLSADLTGVG